MNETLVQTLVERSIFEAIRLKLLAAGYIPDQTNVSFLGSNGSANWEAALETIKNTKGFAIEVFQNSSSQSKGLKRVPRIVIIPRRSVPGDIGIGYAPTIELDPNDPDKYIKVQNPYITSDFHLDVHLVTNTADQHRFIHWIWHSSIGDIRYVPVYNDSNQKFLMQRFGYYDMPDTIEGIQENVFSYEVKDLYMYDGDKLADVAKINEITLETTLMENAILLSNGTLQGNYTQDGNLTIDLSGIKFN